MFVNMLVSLVIKRLSFSFSDVPLSRHFPSFLCGSHLVLILGCPESAP